MRGLPCLAVVAIATIAHASPPTVAVRDFRGPAASKMRAGVIAALSKQVHVVKKAATAEKVIEGVVAKKGRKYKLTVTVRNAASGTWIDDVVITLGRPSLSPVAKKKLVPKILALIGGEELLAKPRGKKQKNPPPEAETDGDANGAAAAFASDDETAEETPAPSDVKPARAEAKPAKIDATPVLEAEAEPAAPAKPDKEQRLALAAPATTVAAAGPKPADTEIIKETPAAPAGHGEILVLAAGATVQTRSFNAVGFGRLPVYNSEPYGSAWVQGELYPLGFLHTFPRGLGFHGTFERAIGLKSKIADTGQVYDSFAQRWEVGGDYRAHFGGAAGPTFRLFGVFGRQEFDIGGMSDMPDVNYEYLGGGLDLDLPLFVSAIALCGNFQYDDLQKLGGAAIFGTTPSAFGYAFEGGLRFDLPWRLRGVATFMDTVRKVSFTGMSPTGVTASETRDEWIGGRVALVVDF